MSKIYSSDFEVKCCSECPFFPRQSSPFCQLGGETSAFPDDSIGDDCKLKANGYILVTLNQNHKTQKDIYDELDSMP